MHECARNAEGSGDVRVLAALVVIAVIVALIYGIKSLAARRRQRQLDESLEMIREIAWQYRDISPELSAVIIDEVNQKKKEIK